MPSIRVDGWRSGIRFDAASNEGHGRRRLHHQVCLPSCAQQVQVRVVIPRRDQQVSVRVGIAVEEDAGVLGLP